MTDEYDGRNTFCYILNGGLPGQDTIQFNGQRRQLPNGPMLSEEKRLVERVCGQMCREKVGGMEALSELAVEIIDKDVDKPGGLWKAKWGHVEFYPYIDDMCDGCA